MTVYTISLCLLFCFCNNETKKTDGIELQIEQTNEVTSDSLITDVELADESIADITKEESQIPGPKKNKSVPVDVKTEFKETIEQVEDQSEVMKDERPPVEEPKEFAGKIEQFDQTNGLNKHDAFDKLLLKHVSTDGRVDYIGFKQDVALLNEYLGILSVQKSGAMKREEALAYWINTYNAFTIKLILDHYPISSITDLEGGKPWDKKWITINSKIYSLNQIENEIIRPQFKEPRIHFAVNCAAKSCPPLMNRAWTASNLEESLEKQTIAFINNSKYNSISKTRIAVSKIFEWYKDDFGNLIKFLNKYSKEEISRNAQITFLEYNWALNK